MDYVDRLLTCADCGREFIFSADEQQFFHLKGYTNTPKRCLQCRTRRQRATVSLRRPIVETAITCAKCGKETTVPFRPRGGKPVLCATCFQAEKNPPAPGPQPVK